ncbi:hypothetical protein J4404_03695 [Candidatus Woesearchaeota archaeon]|nr:hypothetical protein [Candidatus Woesearchaeota archaeon]
MNKRGFEKEYLYLFYLILAVVAGSIILTFIIQVKNDTRFTIDKLSLDSTFLINAISASPFDIETKVSFQEEGFVMNFKANPCSIEVFSKDQTTNLNPYSCYSKLNIENKQLEALFITLKKQGDSVKIE